MKYLYTLILSILMLGINSEIFAQLNISAELRTRAEAVNAYKYLPDSLTKPEYFISQRTRIKANFKKDFYETHISLQDVRVWGSENVSSKAGVWANTNSFDIYEAWVKFNLNKYHFLKIGKQELKYDDQRLLSWRNWNQYGITYDALIYGYRKDKLKIDLGLSYNNDGTAAKNNSYIYDGASTRRMKTLDYLHLNKKFDKLNISAMYLLAGYQKTNSIDTVFLTHTYGAHISYKAKAFSLVGNSYFQSGKSFNGKEINGSMMATLDGNVFLMDKKLTLKAGLAYFSGADGTNTDSLYNTQVHTFDLMYGARFKYYGYQNMFTLMDSHTKNGGLTDIHFGFDYKPNKNNIIKLDYHIFSTSKQVFKQLNGTTREYYDTSLGSEIDLMYIHKFNKEVKVRAGFSYYLANETIETFKSVKGDVGSPFWGWIMIEFNPTLFTK